MSTEKSNAAIWGHYISSSLKTLRLIKIMIWGTLPSFFFWESSIYVTYLNKWELTLYLLWRSDEKSLWKIVKKKNVADYTRYGLISTCHQVLEILKGGFLQPFSLTGLTCPAACQVKFMDWILTGIAGILCCALLKSCVKGAIFPSETIKISSSSPGLKHTHTQNKAIKLAELRRIQIRTCVPKEHRRISNGSFLFTKHLPSSTN